MVILTVFQCCILGTWVQPLLPGGVHVSIRCNLLEGGPSSPALTVLGLLFSFGHFSCPSWVELSILKIYADGCFCLFRMATKTTAWNTLLQFYSSKFAVIESECILSAVSEIKGAPGAHISAAKCTIF